MPTGQRLRAGEIDELLETMDGNYLDWLPHMPPLIPIDPSWGAPAPGIPAPCSGPSMACSPALGRAVTPLGAFMHPLRRSESAVQLHPGDRLLLHTDGLIERRGRSIDDGINLPGAARHRALGLDRR